MMISECFDVRERSNKYFASQADGTESELWFYLRILEKYKKGNVL